MGLHILPSEETVQIGIFFISRDSECRESFISSPSVTGSFWKTTAGGKEEGKRGIEEYRNYA
jgi:hypothetical protein